MAKNIEARLTALTNAQLAHVYNCVSERQITKFADHTTAVNRTAAALEKAGMDFTVEGATVTVGAPAKTPGREGDDRRITVVAEGNPKAVGSKSARRFALYRTGMTVAEYIAAVAPLGGGRRKAVRDITWDTAHGFITVA